MKTSEAKLRYSHERRAWLKQKGYCVNCGKDKAVADRTLCPRCLERARERTQKYLASMTDEERKDYNERQKTGRIRRALHPPTQKRG